MRHRSHWAEWPRSWPGSHLQTPAPGTAGETSTGAERAVLHWDQHLPPLSSSQRFPESGDRAAAGNAEAPLEQSSEGINPEGITDKKLSHPSLKSQITIPHLQTLPSSPTDWKQSSRARHCRAAPAAALTCSGRFLMSCSVSRAQTRSERVAAAAHTSTASPTTAQLPCRAPSHGAATLTCTQTQPGSAGHGPTAHTAHSSRVSQFLIATAGKNSLSARGLWDNLG